MDPPGFEPGASALQGQRSPSLSYGPKDIDFVVLDKLIPKVYTNLLHTKIVY